jgi:hypothetical protein
VKQPMSRRVREVPLAPDRSPEPRPMVDGTLAIWINKRTVSFLDLPFRHRLIGEASGWRLEVLEAGKLLVHVENGHRRGIDVERGDFVLSSGDDVYVALHRAREPTEPDRQDIDGDRNDDVPPQHRVAGS